MIRWIVPTEQGRVSSVAATQIREVLTDKKDMRRPQDILAVVGVSQSLLLELRDDESRKNHAGSFEEKVVQLVRMLDGDNVAAMVLEKVLCGNKKRSSNGMIAGLEVAQELDQMPGTLAKLQAHDAKIATGNKQSELEAKSSSKKIVERIRMVVMFAVVLGVGCQRGRRGGEGGNEEKREREALPMKFSGQETDPLPQQRLNVAGRR